MTELLAGPSTSWTAALTAFLHMRVHSMLAYMYQKGGFVETPWTPLATPTQDLVFIWTTSYQMMMIQVAIHTCTLHEAAMTATSRPIKLAESVSSSTGTETSNSCPSIVTVGLSSLDRAASNVSTNTAAVTAPSFEAWAMVEEKVTLPSEQDKVVL